MRGSVNPQQTIELLEKTKATETKGEINIS